MAGNNDGYRFPSAFCMHNTLLKQRNRQVEHHLDLARSLAIRFSLSTGLDRDDLFQVGVLGLVKASRSYREDTRIPFPVFARPHVRGAILHYLRDSAALVRLPRRLEEEAHRIVSSPEEPVTAREQWIQRAYRSKTRWHQLPDHLPAPCDSQLSKLEDTERLEWARAALMDLPEPERSAVRAVVMEGQSLRTVGSHHGVSAMTIQRRVKRGLHQISQALRSDQPSD